MSDPMSTDKKHSTPRVDAEWFTAQQGGGSAPVLHCVSVTLARQLERELARLYAYLESVCPPDVVVEAKRAATGDLAEDGAGDAPGQPAGSARPAAAALAACSGDMQSTPRTDALLEAHGGKTMIRESAYWLALDHARQLERERNAWEEKCHKAWQEGDRLIARAMKAERELAHSSNARDDLLEVAYMLLNNERRGEALKWARGITGHVAADEKLSIRLEQIADLCAERDDGVTIVEKRVTALSLESAWHKAVGEAFEAIEPGTGDQPETISVWRIKPASESHG